MRLFRQKQDFIPLGLLGLAAIISLREYKTSQHFAHLSQFYFQSEVPASGNDGDDEPDEEKRILGTQQRSLVVACGDTLSSMLKDMGISLQDIDAITRALSKHYNVKNLQIGQSIDVVWESGEDASKLTRLETVDSAGNAIKLEATESGYTTSVCKRMLVAQLKSVSGIVTTNFAIAAQQNGIPNAVAHEAVRALTPLINVGRLKSNAAFEIVFEEKLDANTKKLVGKRQLKYAAVSVDGKLHKVYSFGNRYYSESGHSLKTEFLIVPIRSRSVRISSRFGMRLHPIFRVMKKHCGVDYEARYGTDVCAAASGVVVSACSYGGYGLYVRIRHANGFETAYGHLSAILVRKGDCVNQGDRIGRVGSSGHATGPHLHHEVIRHQIHVDPQKYLSIGSGKLTGHDFERFKQYKDEIDRTLKEDNAHTLSGDISV
ncbi:MAG: M23 family metallopeptidase [Holosporales bacterium]|jgi:murein DD-endopeptidase MepM/ murein hydrolase activator NlpD|nr:M23 family metallopeptidase [Holosporales bacterium]